MKISLNVIHGFHFKLAQLLNFIFPAGVFLLFSLVRAVLEYGSVGPMLKSIRDGTTNGRIDFVKPCERELKA